jgi:hypothetical protein
MRRCLAFVLALLLIAPPASAHEGVPGIRVVLDETDEALAELDIEIAVSVAPQLVLRNTTDQPVEVLDDGGVPFLRIGPDGVEANINAAAWYQTNDPFAISAADLPERARVAGAALEWRRVAQEPSWGWFDHRLHPEGLQVPPEVIAAGERVELRDWAVPFRYGDALAEVRGHVEYRPQRGNFQAALVSPAQPADGVTVAVLQGRVPGLFVDNTTDTPVVVLGSEGEPFLRIGPDDVEANLRSPSWQTTARGTGATPEVEADADAPPQWQTVGEGSRYGWLEFRAVYPEEEPPEPVVETGGELVDWTVPLEVDGERREVAGVTSWVPAGEPAAAAAPVPAGDESSLRPLLLAGAVVVLLGVAFAARRRRSVG